MKKILIKIIGLYQMTLSPDHSWLKYQHPYGFCRFYPSCSEYTKQSINKYGSLKGLLKGLSRILRCNPYIKPKIDLA